MTREMNKPNFEITYRFRQDTNFKERKYKDIAEHCWGFLDKEGKPKERILNPDIAEFFYNCCKMERLEK